MALDWNTAYKELLKELGRLPTSEEVRRKMYDASEAPFVEFPDTNMDYKDIPF